MAVVGEEGNGDQQSPCKERGCCLTIESRAFHQANGANRLRFLMINPSAAAFHPCIHGTMLQSRGQC